MRSGLSASWARASWALAVAVGLLVTSGLHAQDVPGVQDAQAVLASVKDRELRRSLLDRFRRGKIDVAGLKAAIEQASGSSAQASQIAAPRAPGPRPDPDRPLGATLAAGGASTTFRVFAPRAFAMSVYTFHQVSGGKGAETRMTRAEDGIWEATAAVGAGTYYDFTCDGPAGAGEKFDRDRHLSDPYAKANVSCDGRSIVIDNHFDWGRTTSFRPPAIPDVVVYELHLKDWTASPSSGVTDAARHGKFLGLTDAKLLGHFKELGVNTVELLPVHEFDNKAAPPGHINYWGYMTTHFFAPESSYATGIEKGEGVRELKAAIKAMHEAGVAVVLDVVYNHTAEGDNQGPNYNLKGFDNPYYYRLTPDKAFYMNGTGTGNEYRTESPMARRLVIDSLKYWMAEYHVDGFRFDLGASLDRDTMFAIESALPPWTILIAEPWTADWNRKQWVKEDMRGHKWALWNDGFRESLRAFVNGDGKRNDVMTALSGSCMWWAGSPVQSVNYLECHDGATMEDLLHGDVQKNKLGAVALLTGQGMPMLQSGQEFRRSKKGNDNSYDQDTDVNWMDWSLKTKNRDVFDFYAGLLSIRQHFKAMRHGECLSDSTIEWLKPENEKGLGYLLKQPGEPGVLVLLNSDPTNWISFKLPAGGNWQVLCNGDKAALDGLGAASGDYKVPPLKGVILRTP